MFNSPHSHVVIGSLGILGPNVWIFNYIDYLSGLTDIVAYAFLSIFNKLIMANEDEAARFLFLFTSLALCSLLASGFSCMVNSKPQSTKATSGELKTF